MLLKKNNTLVLVIIIVLIILFNIGLIHTIDNKNKFRMTLLFDGIINKTLLLLIILFILIENKELGIICMVLFFTLYSTYLYIPKTHLLEGFQDYYISKK